MYRRRDERDSSVEHIGRGESYRPGGHHRDRSPRDSYRSNRSPPRGPPSDSYIPGGRARPRSRSPGGFRRRSRSPRGATSWRDRDRSPPRRGFSPAPRADTYRRDDRERSPRRDARYDDRFARSPPRHGRSPIGMKRSRDASPNGSRGYRSPKRERLASPRPRYGERSPPRRTFSPPRDRGYGAASRSPRRPDPYTVDNWRRRSPSQARDAREDHRASGRESAATSRRSSPPQIHPNRSGFVPEERPSRPPPQEARSPPYAARRRSPSPSRQRDLNIAPPTGPAASFRNGDPAGLRAPPTGPSGARGAPSAVPPSAPRGASNPILSAPSRPRGGFGGAVGGGSGGFGAAPHHATRDYQPGPPAAPRRTSMQFANPSYRAPSTGPAPGRPGPPTGPSGRGGGPPPPPFQPSFSVNNSGGNSSTTYTRTQRFRDELASLPQIVPGGQKQPDPYNSAKLLKLEEELERARKALHEREEKLRPEIRNWEKLERESEKAGLRSQLAEEALRGLSGEEVGGAAF